MPWRPDGKAFDFLENSREGAKIWRRPFTEKSEPQLILSLPSTQLDNFSWSADHKNLVLARGKIGGDVIL